MTLRAALAKLNAPALDSARPETAGEGLHRVPVWNDRRYRMVASIPPNSGRSAWENNTCEQCGEVDASPDDADCPMCGEALLRPVVEVDETRRLVSGFRNSSYRRMAPDRPAAAVTTASGRIGSDNTLHPSENRVLSMLECQHLQTIPVNFEWGEHLERHGHTSLREMIGEAVPPQFTELHGRVLASLLEGHTPRHSTRSDDPRVLAAQVLLGLDRHADSDSRPG